jgi:hypothetical protein
VGGQRDGAVVGCVVCSDRGNGGVCGGQRDGAVVGCVVCSDRGMGGFVWDRGMGL